MPFLLLLLDYWPLGRMGGRHHPVPGTVPDPTAGIIDPVDRGEGPASCPLRRIERGDRSGAKARRGNGRSSFTQSGSSSGQCRGRLRAVSREDLLARIVLGFLSIIRDLHLPVWQSVGCFLLLILITALVLLRLRQSPWLAVGWFWFIGTLVPVIGLVQVGAQSIADRYTYFPLIGIFIMIAWEVPELLKGLRVGPRALGAASMLVIVVLSGLTWRQLGFWESDETLFRHANSVTKDNCVAKASLAEALLRKGDLEEAYGYLPENAAALPQRPTVVVQSRRVAEGQGRVARGGIRPARGVAAEARLTSWPGPIWARFTLLRVASPRR